MRVIFLDRDGVINKYPGDSDYVKSWEEFSFLPEVIPSLKELKDNGFGLCIISNQAGVGTGIFSRSALDSITTNMLRQLKKAGVELLGVYYCTHRPQDNCPCRKPKTGLIDKAIADFFKLGIEVDFQDSYFIGDSLVDVETGKNAGLKTVLLFSGKEKPANRKNWSLFPDFTALDLKEAVGIIVALHPF